MDVSDQPLHKYMAMCFLIQKCCCVIRLVGITQIPSFLLHTNEGWILQQIKNLLQSIVLKEDFDCHQCFHKISWYFYPCEDFEKKAQSVLNYNLDHVLDFKNTLVLSFIGFSRILWKSLVLCNCLPRLKTLVRSGQDLGEIMARSLIKSWQDLW